MADGIDFIRHDEIEVGDWLDMRGFGSDRHGVVAAIRPYRCGLLGHDPKRCEHADWRYLVFQDGVEVTITPGGAWPGAKRAACGD